MPSQNMLCRVPDEVFLGRIILKIHVQVADEPVAAQEVLIVAPLVENGGALVGTFRYSISIWL